jgi:two-component system chemotaxis sensor kinase CheA
MNPLLEQFLQEARENLAFIEQNIENIDSDDPELLNSVFRAAHTLKGGSGIVGFESVKEITHHAEDLLDMLRGGKLTFQPEMTEALYNAFDEVLNLIEAAEETEDIVDADDETVSQIIAELSGLMGKSDEGSAAWECPFTLGQDQQRILNLPMGYLQGSNAKIPFVLGELDEAKVEGEQLYGIVFDIDESCMVYGNDPIYTLSLLGDKVVGIYSCMGEEAAKSVLSGLDDEDGLTLKVELIAFIHGTYAEIEDALFNFVDELQFYPLDVQRLLQISFGETGHQLDVMKELSSEVLGAIRDANSDDLAEAIDKSLQLIGSETIQYKQLSRLRHILGMIDEADLPKLEGFVSSLQNGQPYSGGDVAVSVPSTPTEPANAAEPAVETVAAPVETAVEPAAPAVDVETTPLTEEIIKRMFEQQRHSLQSNDSEENIERVVSIMEHCRPYMPAMPATFAGKDDLLAWIEVGLGNAEATPVEAAVAPQPTPTPVETVPAATPEPAPAVTPEPVAAPAATSKPAPAAATPVAATPEPAKKPAPKPREETKKNVIGKTVKIEQESIDSMMNIVGELLVAKNSLPYLAQSVNEMNPTMISRAIMEKYTFINRLSEQLQDLIMSMRMLPISYVFDRYPKLVRDISKNLGKKVRLEMDGGDTKLDKNMIEMLADPMIHIMRNSLDHGIEAPDVRTKKGKSAEGHVTLNAYAQSDKIIIEIKDDGAGINVDKVVNKVLEKGLLTLEQIEAMNDDEKAELVMLPGLSTADAISEYSGRGVGMDVVRKSIEGFSGSINIRTVPNQGTTITLAIPVSLAVTSLLHVSMSGVHYGLPMDSVSETVKIDREEIEYLHNEPFVYIRGEVIPLLFIKSMLDEPALEGKQLPIVVLNIKGNLLAVVVNELLGQLDVVQKPMEGVMEDHPIFSGTSLLGNGQIIMAIDPLGLLGIAHELKQDDEKAS